MDLQGVEKYLQDKIFLDLEKGRPYFDKPHTTGVVQKVKDLIAHNPQLHLMK